MHRWFANPDRYGWYVLIRVARVGFSPFLNLAAVILVKRLVIGKFQAGKRDLSQLALLKHWLMSKLMPGGDLRKVCNSESGRLDVKTKFWALLCTKHTSVAQ